ncbi:MAG: hypothetical protein HY870_02695 [Chloroflexi bacterium]|nr:hypothetical protein [Chloroflexota bacterium]
MVNLTGVSPKRGWLFVLCAIALGLSLVAPVVVEAAGGSLDVLASQRGSEDNLPAAHAEAFDSLDDSALLTTAGVICWHPVVFAFNLPLPAEWVWSSTPPVRPPIFANSI